MTTLSVEIKILDDRLKENLPTYATPGSAAVDLHACIESEQSLTIGETQLIPSGISIHLADDHYAALIIPRSGLGHKQGIVLGNLTGLIDSDYQGEIKVSLWNRSSQDYIIQPFERIAQMIVVPIVKVKWHVVEQFVESHRGEGGFGSTGQ